MAQVCVVNCSSCETFQGQLVKKGKKWTCKMCGEKQSFRKIFAQGSGKECRQVVQKLNMISGNLKRRMLEENVENSSETTGRNETGTQEACMTNEGNDSKWNQFLSSSTSNAPETENPDENCSEGSFTTDREIFSKYVRAAKRTKLMKEITSDSFIDHPKRKLQKNDHSKGTYPNNRAGKSDMSPKCIPLESTVSCTITKPSQEQTSTIAESPGANVSKWLKYI